MLFSSSRYRRCATLDWAQWALEQAQAGGRERERERERKKSLKRSTVKSVCAVTSAEPSNELVALPQSRSQETNHSSRFKTEGYCWAGWTLRSAPALVRTFYTSSFFSPVMVSRIRLLFFPFLSLLSVHAFVTLSACQIAYQTGVGC